MKVYLDFRTFTLFAGLDFLAIRHKEFNHLPIFHNKIPVVEKTQNLFITRHEKHLNYFEDIIKSADKSLLNSVSIYDKTVLNIADFDYDGGYDIEFTTLENKEEYVTEDMMYIAKFLANRYLNMIDLFSPKRVFSQHIPSIDIGICSYICQLLGIEIIGIEHSAITADYGFSEITKYEYMTDGLIAFGRNSLENLESRVTVDDVNITLLVTDLPKKIEKKLDNYRKDRVVIFGNFYEKNEPKFNNIVDNSLEIYDKFIENHQEIEFIYKPHPLNDDLGILKRHKNIKVVDSHEDVMKSEPLCAFSIPSDVILEYSSSGLPFIVTSEWIRDFYLNADKYMEISETIDEVEDSFQKIVEDREAYYEKMIDLYNILYKGLPTIREMTKEIINR